MYNILGAPNEDPKESEPWKNSALLQTCVIPKFYELMLKPQFDFSRIYGHETITVKVTEAIKFLTLHVKDLKITSTQVTSTEKDAEEILIKSSFYYEPYEFWVIELMSQIKPGSYNLDFEFEGTLKSKLEGCGRWSYQVEKPSRKRQIIATNFKTVSARRVFPCFDEPEKKAVFKLRLVRPMEKYVAITNETIEKEDFGPGKNEVTLFFKETRPMSTFQSGFVICELKESTPANVENRGQKLPIKVLTAPEKLEKSALAREVAAHATKYFIEYFDSAFPLAKLDLVALPDFPARVVNQWGFITFKETEVLYDEQINSVNRKKYTALSIASEICRQWFGGLVTLKWWDDLWMVEGFAALMKYKALDEGIKGCREWRLMEQVIHDVIHKAMNTDAVLESHPLQCNIEDPTKVNIEVDNLMANKGLAIFKMLESFVGKECFRRGIHRFLESYALSNGTSADLWQCLNDEIRDPDLDIGSIMDTWTKQAGFPVIYAIRRANTWILSQSRFFSDRESFCNVTDSPFRYKWDVPIHYITSNDRKPVLVWFRRNEECLKITVTDRTVTYLKFNQGQTGFYRVNYEGCLWWQFSQLLQQNLTRFNAVDRANLLDDAFHLAEAGQMDYAYMFELLKFIERETEYLPWATASRDLKKLLGRLPNSQCFCLLLKLIRSLVGKLYGSADGQFNWNSTPSDSQIKRLLRRIILDLACLSKLPECMTDVTMKFKEWINTGIFGVSPDLVDLLLRHGMLEVNTEEDWEVVLSRYQKESVNEIKKLLLECLASVGEPWLAISLLEGARCEFKDSEFILLNEYLAKNPYVSSAYWCFVRNEWEYLEERYSSCIKEISNVVFEFVRKYNTTCQLDEVEKFYERHPNVGAEVNAKKRAIESISRNITFIKRHQEAIAAWLYEYLSPSS